MRFRKRATRRAGLSAADTARKIAALPGQRHDPCGLDDDERRDGVRTARGESERYDSSHRVPDDRRRRRLDSVEQPGQDVRIPAEPGAARGRPDAPVLRRSGTITLRPEARSAANSVQFAAAPPRPCTRSTGSLLRARTSARDSRRTPQSAGETPPSKAAGTPKTYPSLRAGRRSQSAVELVRRPACPHPGARPDLTGGFFRLWRKERSWPIT